MDFMTIETQVDTLIPHIKALPVYQEFQTLGAQVEANDALLVAVTKYQKLQEEYTNNVLKYDRYHPDNKSLQAQLVECKTLIATYPEFRLYQRSARALQSVLDEIATMMNEILPHKSGSCGSGCTCHTK